MKENLTDPVLRTPQYSGTTLIPDSPRYDGYHGIHKALRLFMCERFEGRQIPAQCCHD